MYIRNIADQVIIKAEELIAEGATHDALANSITAAQEDGDYILLSAIYMILAKGATE